MKKSNSTKIALALTWDGTRWPMASLPPKARSFLQAPGYTSPTPREAAKLFVANAVAELRLCWIPRLKGGNQVLAEIFPAPKGKRVPFRAKKATRFGDLLGVLYKQGK